MSGGLRHWVSRGFQRLSLAVAGDAAAAMVKAVINPKGSVEVRGISLVDDRFRRLQIERTRLAAEANSWQVIEESTICGEGLYGMAEMATCRPFQIRCADKAGLKILTNLFKRIGYYNPSSRTDYMARIFGIGNLMLIPDRGLSARARGVEQINRLRVPPSFQIMRLTNPQGDFFNPEKAYVQFPWLEMQKIPANVPKELTSTGQVMVDGAAYVVPGLIGGKSGLMVAPRRDGRPPVYFSAEEMIHARYRPHFQPVATGYGVSVFRSGYQDINRLQYALYDMGTARALSAYARAVFEFGSDASPASVDEFKTELARLQKEGELGPASGFVLHNGKAYLLDAKNHQLMKVDDIWMLVQFVGLMLKNPLELFGLGAERLTGEIMDQLIQRLKSSLTIWNQVEEYELLRPLAQRELFYQRKLGVEFEFVFPELSIEDINKKLKRDSTRNQDQSKSRLRTIMEHDQATEAEARSELDEIEAEQKRFGAPERYQAPGENIRKGKQGVTKKDTADQDISE